MTPTPLNRLRLFGTAFLQVLFVACSTVFIANHQAVGVVVSAFAVSLVWTLNVRQVAIGGWPDRFVYATGAACGSLTGMYLAATLSKWMA